MAVPRIEIRHGRFTDLTGPPQKFGELTFAPAEVELSGSMFDLTHRLDDYLHRYDVPAEVKPLLRSGEDAVWVRGRAQQLFQIPNTSAENRGEKTFFSALFLALVPDEAGHHLGVPFECTDHYGGSGLVFSSEDPPSAELQHRIAEAFWGLLLSEPANIQDYRDCILHSGAGVWVDFGIADGEPFVEERP